MRSKHGYDLSDKDVKFQKDFTVLSGTAFATSLALAIDKDPNGFFIFGELFLFIALLFGITRVFTSLRAEESMFYFDLMQKYKTKEIVSPIKDEFYKTHIKDEIVRLDKAYKQTQSGIIYWYLKLVPVDYLSPISYITMLIGFLLLLLSVMI